MQFQSCRTLYDLWTVAHQAPVSMGLSRQEYWNGLPWPFSGYLPDSVIELVSLMSPTLAGGFFSASAIWEAQCISLDLCIFLMLVRDIEKTKALK